VAPQPPLTGRREAREGKNEHQWDVSEGDGEQPGKENNSYHIAPDSELLSGFQLTYHIKQLPYFIEQLP